jgi:putative transposase
MAEALRQSVPTPQSDDWITAECAAQMTREPVRTWTWRATRECLTARQEQRQSLAAKMKDATGRLRWYLHRSLDARLAEHPSKQRDEARIAAALIERYPEHQVEKALQKNHWLKRWIELCQHQADGLTDRELAAKVVAEAREHDRGFKLSVRSLYRWRSEYQKAGEHRRIRGVEALVDKHRGPGEPIKRSPEAIEYFYSLYRTTNKLGIAECHRWTLAEAQRQGWTWPETYNATTAWLKTHDDLEFSFLCRYGAKAYSKRWLRHLTMDWSAIAPGIMYVADHKQVDFWVRYKGGLIRPWLTAVQDCRSRMIVGWHLGPTPHQDAIKQAYFRAFRDYGIPKVMRIDNGKDFASRDLAGFTRRERNTLRRMHGPEWLETVKALQPITDKRWLGILNELDVRIIFATPYAPWSKGTVERWFGTFGEQCAKHFITWCGDKPESKPDALKDILKGKLGRDANGLQLNDKRAIPTMEDAAERIGHYIVRYHNQEHRGQGMNGKTPADVWRDKAVTIRKADDEALALLMGVRGVYKVGNQGVRVGKLGYGARSRELRRYAGRNVLVSVDLDSPSLCYAFDGKTRRLIDKLEPNQTIHPCSTHDDVREAIADIKRDQSVMDKARRASVKRTRTLAQRLNAQVADQVARLATGTDGATATITPVSTGFEGTSKTLLGISEPRPFTDLSEAYKRMAAKDHEAGEAKRAAGADFMQRFNSLTRPKGTPEAPVEDPYAHINIVDLAAEALEEREREEDEQNDDPYADVDLTGLWDDDPAEGSEA